MDVTESHLRQLDDPPATTSNLFEGLEPSASRQHRAKTCLVPGPKPHPRTRKHPGWGLTNCKLKSIWATYYTYNQKSLYM